MAAAAGASGFLAAGAASDFFFFSASASARFVYPVELAGKVLAARLIAVVLLFC